MLLQRVLVWGHTHFQTTIDVHGITLVEHPDFDVGVLQNNFENALGRIATVDSSLNEYIHEHVRVVVITNKLKSVLAPYGAAFLPGGSPVWQDPRKLAGWIVWVAAYVAASKEFRITGRTVDAAAVKAKKTREDFYRAHDLVIGEIC